MLTKPCGRDACHVPISARYLAELKRRRYCGHRCAALAGGEAIRRGHHDKALWRACRAVQKALGVEGDPPEALVRIVRRLRHQAYQAGHSVVVHKLRRAVARGVLVHHRKTGAAA